MSIKIPEDLIKIKLDKQRNLLLAYMPNGEKLPCITEINILSGASMSGGNIMQGKLIKAQITVLVDLSQMNEGEKLERVFNNTKQKNMNNDFAGF
jgi:hypothetical protein